MSEISKYEILLNELQTLESQVMKFRSAYYQNAEKVKVLEELVRKEQSEIESLKEQILLDREQKLAFDINNGDKILNSLEIKEKEELKVKLQLMVTKIDSYLSS